MPTSASIAVTIDDVSHQIDGARVLSSISLVFRTGEIVGVVGACGSGKSTLLRVLAGELRPRSGSVHVLGAPIRAVPRGTIGYLPSHDVLSGRHRVSAEAEFFQKLRGLASPDVEAWAKKWRQRFVAETAKRRLSELPDGHRRCIELGSVLQANPRLIVLDGPFRGMTGSLASAAVIALAEAASNGSTIVLADTRLDLLDSLCTRIVVMSEGKVAHDGLVGAIASVGASRVWLVRTSADLSGCTLVERALPIGRDTRVTLREGANREEFLRWILDKGERIEALRPARSLADVLSDVED